MSGSGWYRLPSGITVHVRADKPLAAADVDVLDALAQYLRRHMLYATRQEQAWEDDGGRPGPPVRMGPPIVLATKQRPNSRHLAPR